MNTTFALTISEIVPTGALRRSPVICRYIIVKVVFEGATPNLSLLIRFDGSNVCSEIKSLPCKFKTVLFGSAIGSVFISASPIVTGKPNQ